MFAEPLSESARRVWRYIREHRWQADAEPARSAAVPDGAARGDHRVGARCAPLASRRPSRDRPLRNPARTGPIRYWHLEQSTGGSCPHKSARHYNDPVDRFARPAFHQRIETTTHRVASVGARAEDPDCDRQNVPRSVTECDRRLSRANGRSARSCSSSRLGPPQYTSTPASVAPCNFADEIISASQTRLSLLMQRRPPKTWEGPSQVPSLQRDTDATGSSSPANGPNPKLGAEECPPSLDQCRPVRTPETRLGRFTCTPEGDTTSGAGKPSRPAADTGAPRPKEAAAEAVLDTSHRQTAAAPRSAEVPCFSLLSPFGLTACPQAAGDQISSPERQLSEQVPSLSETASDRTCIDGHDQSTTAPEHSDGSIARGPSSPARFSVYSEVLNSEQDKHEVLNSSGSQTREKVDFVSPLPVKTAATAAADGAGKRTAPKVRPSFDPVRRSDGMTKTAKQPAGSLVAAGTDTKGSTSCGGQEASKTNDMLMGPPLYPIFHGRRSKRARLPSNGTPAVDDSPSRKERLDSRSSRQTCRVATRPTTDLSAEHIQTVTSRPRESPDRQRARTATRHEGELTALLLAVSSGSAIASLTAECAEPLARALQEPTITCVCLCLEHDDGGSQLRPVTERRSGALLPGHAALVAAVVGGRLDGVTIRLRPDGMSTGAVSAVAAALLAGAGRRVCWGARELLLFMLRRCGVRAADGFRCWRLRDLTIADWLLEPDRPSRQFCEVLSELGAQSGTAARDAALSRQEQLAADLRQLAQLDTAMAQRLRTAGLLALFELVETPLATVLAAMEAHGVQVDVARLHAAAAACQRQLRCLEAAAQRAAGTVFSLSSSAQLRRLLYDELRLDARSGVSVPLTDRGLKSTSEQALQRLLAAHPLPGLVIQHRRLLKFKSTYVEGVLAQVRGGGVFPQWLQTAAATGRVQAAAPNLQSVPKRPLALTTDGGDTDDRNAVLARSPFVARSGHTLLSMDFCQMELRLLAHLSRDACLMAAIRDAPSGDIFRQLAALWTGEPADAIDDAQRERTKRLVYAAMYGAGRHRLAEVLQCEPQQAQRALDSFLAQCPAIGAFSSQVVAECRRAGLVSSLLGRRRRVAAIMSSQHLARSQAERQAVNFVIQGSAADLCKLVMVAVAEAAPDVPLLAQLHDELLWEVPQGRLGEFRALVERQVGRLDALLAAAGHRQPLLVPLPVSIAAGVCWAQMEPLPPADRA